MFPWNCSHLMLLYKLYWKAIYSSRYRLLHLLNTNWIFKAQITVFSCVSNSSWKIGFSLNQNIIYIMYHKKLFHLVDCFVCWCSFEITYSALVCKLHFINVFNQIFYFTYYVTAIIFNNSNWFNSKISEYNLLLARGLNNAHKKTQSR